MWVGAECRTVVSSECGVSKPAAPDMETVLPALDAIAAKVKLDARYVYCL